MGARLESCLQVVRRTRPATEEATDRDCRHPPKNRAHPTATLHVASYALMTSCNVREKVLLHTFPDEPTKRAVNVYCGDKLLERERSAPSPGHQPRYSTSVYEHSDKLRRAIQGRRTKEAVVARTRVPNGTFVPRELRIFYVTI